MLELATLLAGADADVDRTLVFRHRPYEPGLRNVLGWLAQEEHDLFNLYQSTHGPRTEAALRRAEYLAAFIGHAPGKAVFVGLYRQRGTRVGKGKDITAQPGFDALFQLGMTAWDEAVLDGPVTLFELELLPALGEWKGKLIVDWPSPDRSWYRWASPSRNSFPVAAILEESNLVRPMPAWDELLLNWAELQTLPASWKRRLSEWRGIYLIFDSSDGKSYVGSAAGAENLLGRWLNYAASGHGGNQLLKGRAPAGFRFSILQRTSPDLPVEETVALEASWKTRLHTRAPWGLNAN